VPSFSPAIEIIKALILLIELKEVARGGEGMAEI
jgi:hypothetical protein